MAFTKIEECNNSKMLSLVPDPFKNFKYVKVKKGDIFEVNRFIFSKYPAKNKTTREPIVYKDGTPVMRTTVYIQLDENKYTTWSSNKQVDQCISWVIDRYNEDVIDYNLVEYGDNAKIKFGEIDIQGKDNKKFPIVIFDSVVTE